MIKLNNPAQSTDIYRQMEYFSNDINNLWEIVLSFTRPQRKAADPKAMPTRNQLGLVRSGLEPVITDLDPTEKYKNTFKTFKKN